MLLPLAAKRRFDGGDVLGEGGRSHRSFIFNCMGCGVEKLEDSTDILRLVRPTSSTPPTTSYMLDRFIHRKVRQEYESVKI